jgi:UDP-GlcNAc:undecaprenyl-phosphate GlcNAc-1-phosphate transferase
MTTILFAFVIAFAVSLVLTPWAKRLGVRLEIIDRPSARNAHERAIPRSGGIAILVSFFVALIACVSLSTLVSDLLILDRRRSFAILGGFIVFGIGLFDDFHRLGPRIKFLFQLLAASLAYYGGVRIEGIVTGGIEFQFGILSYFLTVFWFLLLINAINLIDGLDGLAAGVAFFTSIVMVILTIMQVDYLAALEFAALAGALLGFLRYNFNPASIFMGDAGSYFIGYVIAAIAILGSIKSQVGATLLIPLLALGVPIFDTILSPVRRFIRGRKMFQPDQGHIHHRLMEMGLSSRRAVLIIYGISCGLCLLAITLVNLRNEMAGLLLIVLGTAAFIIVRKLGYLEYFAADKLLGWLRDLSDEAGFTRNRRSFLSLQFEIDHARSMEELWYNTCLALGMLRFDRGELHICENGEDTLSPSPAPYHDRERRTETTRRDGGHAVWTDRRGDARGSVRVWARGHYRRKEDTCGNGFLRIEIPLEGPASRTARLILMKDLAQEPVQPYTLRRVEYLRRSVVKAMKRLEKKEERHDGK